MSKKNLLIQSFVLIFVVGLLTQCNAQDKKNDTKVLANAVGVIKSPADEAKIEGDISDYEIKETSLEYLQSLKMPEIKLVFETSNNSKLDLPADAQEILNSHWKNAIKFFYETHLNKIADGQTAYKKDIAWFNYCVETFQKLQKLSIEAPNGKRNISQNEALKLYGFLNEAAVKVMDKAKSIQ